MFLVFFRSLPCLTRPAKLGVLIVLVLSSVQALSQAPPLNPRDLGSLGQVNWGYVRFEATGRGGGVPPLFTFPPDTEIALYDSRGNVLEQNDDIFWPFDRNSRITWNSPVEGRYYLAVGLVDTVFGSRFEVTTTSTTSGSYTLTPSRENTPGGGGAPPFDPIVPGSVSPGSITWYTFTIGTVATGPPIDAVALGVVGNSNSPLQLSTAGSSIDTEIALFSSTGNLILENDDLPDGTRQGAITAPNLTPGTYFVAVGQYNTVFGDDFAAQSNSTTPGNFILTAGSEQPISGQAPPNGVQWFTFSISLPPSDLDGDGIPDSIEDQYSCLDKNIADADADPDEDGIPNGTELDLGTDPCNPDTDADGLPDGAEAGLVFELNWSDAVTGTISFPAGSLSNPPSIGFRESVPGTTLTLRSAGREFTFSDPLLAFNTLVPDQEIDFSTDLVSQINDFNIFVNGFNGVGVQEILISSTGERVSLSSMISSNTDPTNADTDGDGLLDGVETRTGTFVDANDTGTDPTLPDSDGDGSGDRFEIEQNFDPNDATSGPPAPVVQPSFIPINEFVPGSYTPDLTQTGLNYQENHYAGGVIFNNQAEGNYNIHVSGIPNPLRSFDGIEPLASHGVGGDQISTRNRPWLDGGGENFTVRINGYLNMSSFSPGTYNIHLGADDTNFFIMDTVDGQVTAQHNCCPQNQVTTFTITTPGMFPFDNVFGEQAGGDWYDVGISGPGINGIVALGDTDRGSPPVHPIGGSNAVDTVTPEVRLVEVSHDAERDSTQLTWESAPGQFFEIAKSTELSADPATWPRILTDIQAAPGSETSLVVDDAAVEAEAFYKVFQTPPPALPTGDGSSREQAISLGRIPSGELVLDTRGSAVGDTEIGLFGAEGNLIAENDDATDLGLLSRITIALAPGTYYIATGAYNTTFNPAGFSVVAPTSITDAFTVNVISGENNAAPIALSSSGVNPSGPLWFSLLVE